MLLFAKILAVFVIFGTVSPAYADGGEGMRATTAAEKKFFAQIGQEVKKLMPVAPSGWNVVHETGFETRLHVGIGAEEAPVRFSYLRMLEKNDKKAREDQLARKAYELDQAKVARNEQGIPKSMEAKMKRFEELAQKVGQAAERNDMAALQRYQQESEKLSQEIQQAQEKVQSEATVPFAEQRALVGDNDAKVVIEINSIDLELYGKVSRLPSIGGATAAFRRERTDEDEATVEGTTALVFGPWKKADEGDYWIAEVPQTKPHMRVCSVIVWVEGEKKRAEAMLKAMPLKNIQSWLKCK